MRPFDAFCDVPGVSAEQALAPLAGGVTRLVLDLLGSGDALPQLLRLPGCFRALRSVRSLAVRYPRASGGDMESVAAAVRAAVRAAAAAEAAGGGSADIVLARALRPSSRLPEAPQPWDLLSSLTELDVRFLLGNYELVLPPAGMPNLRRLDMRGMMGENYRSDNAAAAAAAKDNAKPMHCLPPPPAVVPNLRWLGIGFFSPTTDPVPRKRRRPQVLNLSELVPAGSSQPYRRLRSLLLHRANLVVEGGGDNDDEEVRRLLGEFPAFYPSLRMIHVHFCVMSSTAKRVLDGLADVYAAIEAAATAGARGGAGGSSSSSSASASHSPPVARTFRGICRGCPAWDFEMRSYRNVRTVLDQEEL
jgi:hypothetical protein